MKKTILLALTAFFAGGAAGLAMGGLRGFDRGASLILNSALAKDAREIDTTIAVLGHVRAGDQKQAIAKLEAGLDDLLIGFDPAEPYPGLEPQTTSAMRKAIDQAKAYRATHPWTGEKNPRADMVKSLFARDLYK